MDLLQYNIGAERLHRVGESGVLQGEGQSQGGPEPSASFEPTGPDQIAVAEMGLYIAIAVAAVKGVVPGPDCPAPCVQDLSLIHISEPTRQAEISYAVF